MESVNPKMLEIVRNFRGLTQLQLCSLVKNLAQGSYSKMEKGLLPVPQNLLLEIAKVLEVPVSIFDYKKPIKDQAEYYYRKRLTMPRKRQVQLESTIDLLKIWIDGLLTSIEIPDFNLPSIEVTKKNTPEEIARKIRSLLRIPKGPIDKPILLLERNGIIVHQLTDVPEKFDALTTVTESGQRVIVLNANMPNDRKRLNLFHELGHIVMHLPFSPILDESRDLEKEANRFASEFLMPELEIRSHFNYLRFSNLGDLKLYWKVSKSALLYRAKAIGSIDSHKYTNLMIELSRSGERKVESIDVNIDSPQLLQKIYDVYLNELGYTTDELAKSISISIKDLNKFILNSNNVRRGLFRIEL